MTIRNRLKIVGIVPILFLVLLSGYFFVTSYLNFEKANALKTILKNNAILSNTLAQTGKERGLTSLYLGSGGKEFSASLTKQRASTDASFKSLKQKLVLKDTSYIPILPKLLGQSDLMNSAKYNILLNNVSGISALRKSVDDQSEDFKQIFFDGYTQKFATPALDNIAQIKNFTLNTDISSLISSLLQLSTAKENAGLERGFIAYYMTKRSTMSFEEIALWNQFKTKANAFDSKQVNNMLHAKLEKVFNDSKAKKLFSRLEETSSAIQKNIYNNGYIKEGFNWFTLQTKKILLLEKAELITSNTLWEKNEAYLQKQRIILAIASIILLMSFIFALLTYYIGRDISRNSKELQVVLNKAIEEMKSSDKYPVSDRENIEVYTPQKREEALVDTDELLHVLNKFLSHKANDALDDEKVKTSMDEPSDKIILIAKAFPIEQKLLIKVIENLGYEYKVLNHTDLLENELLSAHYDVLFTDKELATENISKSNTDLLIITSINSKAEIEALIHAHRG